jgi:hypothetical protein
MTDTPVTKLDSVERLAFEAWCKPDDANQYEPGFWRCWQAAWDLSRREALREAAAMVKSITPVPVAWCNDDHIRPTVAKIAEELERLAVEEGTR